MRIRSKELRRTRKRAEERHKARVQAKAKTTTRRTKA
jgi:hypothetical protein